MKEISLDQAVKTIIEAGRKMSKEMDSIEKVDLIAQFSAVVVFALMHLPTIDIERQGEEWVQQMATISIYDADFFHYEHVIPNLECAKLYTYFHNHHEIAVLTPTLNPAPYTQCYIRKDYNDGIYPSDYFLDNCVYGGRAFNPDHYEPLEDAIERTIPNMHLYDKYQSYFGTAPGDPALYKRILNCAHIRLSTDEQIPKSLNQLKRVMSTGRYSGIVFHDYDLSRVQGAQDIIQEISLSRHYVGKPDVINPYPIGTKFPIQVNNSTDLAKWMDIVFIPTLLLIQYNGLMTDTDIYNLCCSNKRMAKQLYYNISDGCSSENEFLMSRLPKIYPQILFLRRQNIKILLKYDEELIVTPEVRNFIELLNCWLSFKWFEGYLPTTQTLYIFCRDNHRFHYTNYAFRNVTVSTEDARDVFQFFRETDYELFKKFYYWDAVIYEGGQFVNEWRRDQTENY